MKHFACCQRSQGCPGFVTPQLPWDKVSRENNWFRATSRAHVHRASLGFAKGFYHGGAEIMSAIHCEDEVAEREKEGANFVA